MSATTPQMKLFAHAPQTPLRRASAGGGGRACPLRLCVLGSGSGGNSTVLRYRDQAVLIDAGFGPRTLGERLAQAKMDLTQVRAVVLTHLDQDHFRRSWPRRLLREGITLHLHHWHLPDLLRLKGATELREAGLVQAFDDEAFEPLPGLTAQGVRLQHDRQGTIGYRFEAQGGRDGCVGYATDLGHAPTQLLDHLAGVDLLCLECNYDEHMTVHSSRPSWINRRNMSDSGHLSNEQAYEAVQGVCARSPHGLPRHVLLMHRSSQCNHPMKVKRVFDRDAALARRVMLTEQRRRTRWFVIRPLKRMQRQQFTLGF